LFSLLEERLHLLIRLFALVLFGVGCVIVAVGTCLTIILVFFGRRRSLNSIVCRRLSYRPLYHRGPTGIRRGGFRNADSIRFYVFGNFHVSLKDRRMRCLVLDRGYKAKTARDQPQYRGNNGHGRTKAKLTTVAATRFGFQHIHRQNTAQSYKQIQSAECMPKDRLIGKTSRGKPSDNH
jgi:hypothetical protein